MAVREVTGTDLTFFECVDQQVLPAPGLVDFNAWQQWRKHQRPKLAVDGVSTTSRQEAELWRASMTRFHGENWATDLAVRVVEEAEAREAEVAAAPSEGARPPGPPSDAVAPSAAGGVGELAPVTPKRRAQDRRDGPGSGEAPVTSPGSGGRVSPVGSWHSANPGSPSSLTQRIQRPYDAEKEPVETFKARLLKQASALEVVGEPLGIGVLEVLMAKADYDEQLQKTAADTVDEVRILKGEYAMEMCEIDESTEQGYRINALESMLLARQVNVQELKIRLASGGALETPGRRSQAGVAQDPHIAANKTRPESRPDQFRLDGQQVGGSSPFDAGPGSGLNSAVLESMEQRLRQTELALAAKQLEKEAEKAPSTLAEVLTAQGELMSKLLNKEDKPRNASTIRVEPKVFWPRLGDDGPGGREVEEFYEKYEEICGLANNGKGMSDKEMVITIKNCLQGSRKKIYENILKAHKTSNLMETDDGPGQIYREIKSRLFKFVETSMERQLRVKGEWTSLTKTQNMNALQFEAEWERISAEMELVGLGLSKLEKFLSYLVKVGSKMGETIRLDRRPRVNADETTTIRLAETWEEAHFVLLEHEGVKAGTKAFTEARTAFQGGYKGKGKGDPNDQGWQDKGGKGKKGGGKESPKGKGKEGREKPVCFEFRDTGRCKYGDNCRFEHGKPQGGQRQPSAKAKAKAEAKKERVAAAAKKKQEEDAAADKLAAAAKGKGKFGEKKKILCKHKKKGNDCPDKDCPYGHKLSNFDPKTFKYIGKGKGKGGKKGGGKGGAQGEEDGWARPVGLNGGLVCVKWSNPSAAPQCVVDAQGQGLVMTKVGSQEDKKGYKKGKGKWKPQYKPINSLMELPLSCWTKANSDDSGIQFHTVISLGVMKFDVMLDGGSGVNSVTEEIVLTVLNGYREQGIMLSDKAHPIKALEYWDHNQGLRGVSAGSTVPLLGAVVFNMTMLEKGKDTGPAVLVRFKVCQAGATDWVGLILGGRAIDCPERGGLGFIPGPHSHNLTALGIQMERTEAEGGPRLDKCYALKVSVLDSEGEEEIAASATTGFTGAVLDGIQVSQGLPLLYEGEPFVLSQDEAVWIPVRVSGTRTDQKGSSVVLPCQEATVEVLPGIWDSEEQEGVVCVVSQDVFDMPIETGAVVGEVHEAAVQTRVCQRCARIDTDAWVVDSHSPRCAQCATPTVGTVRGCVHCDAPQEECCVLSYTGCSECRPEKELKGKVRKGPAAGMLARAAMTFAAVCVGLGASQTVGPCQPSVTRLSDQSTGGSQGAAEEVKLHPVFHIIEEPGMIAYLSDCEVPTEEYYEALKADMRSRHPKAAEWVLEHLEALEPFLDTSIAAGFSYGVKKAFVVVIKGSLLGDIVSRTGATADPERTQAIAGFAPLKDISQIRQFTGSTNWVRRYLSTAYATAVKILGEYMKPDAVIPAEGLGAGTTRGDLAVKAIKVMCKHAIETAVLDEASAIDGSRPLEQVADACGIAWGSTNVQMTADLAGFKVLCMVGKGFTPAQQAWPAVTLEGFAQLGGKRAQRKLLGPMRSLNWTDHANFTKQQHIELVDIDLKLLRWVAEITSDGSEIRSLAGRAARLGDGTSRNPAERDELMAQRTKDLEGLIGQVRGFDLEEFLSDWDEPGTAVPWAYGENCWVPEEEVSPSQPDVVTARSSDPPVGASVLPENSLNIPKIMTAAGLSPHVKVLYVPDYVPRAKRIATTAALFTLMSRLLPGYTVDLALAEGPFEDHDGIGAHFEKDAIRGQPVSLQLKQLKVDFHVSTIKLARQAAMHKPQIIFGEGQGALVAAGYSKPLSLESALATRNVQPEELSEIGQAWGRVSLVIVHDPKVSKTGVQLDKLKLATPDLFDSAFPVPPRRMFTWKDNKVVHYLEGKQLMSEIGVQVVPSIGDIPFQSLLQEPPTFMWAHNGKCPCGRKSYLFSQCSKCLKNELAEKLQEEQERAQEPDEPTAPEEPVAAPSVPDVLHRLPESRGCVTRNVIFVNDRWIHALASEKSTVGSWRYGPAYVQEWHHGKELKLKQAPANQEAVYRIVFAVETNGDVLPVQQCVNHRFEENHVVASEAWCRDTGLLTGAFCLDAVSEQLSAYVNQSHCWPACSGTGTEGWRSMEGPIKSHLVLVTQPYGGIYVWKAPPAKGKVEQLLGRVEELSGRMQQPPGLAILYGRVQATGNWCVAFIGPFGHHVANMRKQMSKIVGDFDAWALTWGREGELKPRKVVTLFASRWLIYDKHAQISTVLRQPKGQSLSGEARPCGPPTDASVPNTELKEERNPMEMEHRLELTEEALSWYDKKFEERDQHREEARDTIGETDFAIGESLRVTWGAAQRADKMLLPMFSAKTLAEGYRMAPDGVLERMVQVAQAGGAIWVPIVPDGQAAAHLSWKRWVFLQCHVGILGAHRNPEKTMLILSRQVWWQGMKADVEDWINRCITCIRFRKIPQKQEAVAVIPIDAECWEEVMVDLEGPSHPADKEGNKYTLTYICCLCYGVLTDRSAKCNSSEARRMVACCIFRSGTLPTLLRSDRGPEFKNAMMQEYTALIGLGRRFGSPWRPVEQGLVEGKHKETQKIYGMLVKDIMQCFPSETYELRYIVEFIVYNTPGPHGYTPRDIDRRWSLATPLSRELQPFQVCEFEPLSEYAANLFRNYRDIRVRVLGWLKDASSKRAELANRFRTSKQVRPGQQVVLRDPRQRKAGGRTPWRQPHTEPCVVLKVQGNKCKLQRKDGTFLDSVHLEDILVVPDSITDPEQDIVFDDEEELRIDTTERRRSPGEMIEDREKQKQDEPVKPGKLEKVTAGNYIVYSVGTKKCTIGKVISVSKAEANVVVHKHRPVSDSRLRLYWTPVYVEAGEEVLGSGSTPALETVTIRQLLWPVQLHDGVLAHAAARRLDHMEYRLDPDNLCQEDINGKAVKAAAVIPYNPDLKVREESFVAKVERFSRANLGVPSVETPLATGRTQFATVGSFQKWIQLGIVDFAEVYRGFGEATIRVREAGCTAAEGFDKLAITYERCWHLDQKGDQQDFAWMVTGCLRPKVLHLGTPCTRMCRMGKRDADEETRQQNKLTRIVAKHQEANKLGASVENPQGSTLFEEEEWITDFGHQDKLKDPWSFYLQHGCQFKVTYPGKDDPGRPMFKPKKWMANFSLEPMELRCRTPAALAGSSHEHRHIRGTMYVEGRGSCSVAEYSGAYTAEESTVYARCVARFCQKTDRIPTVQSELTRMAARSSLAQQLDEPRHSCPAVSAAFQQFEILAGGAVRNLDTGNVSGEARVPKPVDQFHKVQVQPHNVPDTTEDISKSAETEATAREWTLRHDKDVAAAEQHWREVAQRKDWAGVKADMSVYRYCGEKVEVDPRLSEDYRQKVLDGLQYGDKDVHEHLTEHDVAAIKEVLHRKAAAFWIEGTPRTTLKYLLHDCIPTGPPARTPPHRLRGEEADWVDAQLQEEVESGQLVRGNSEWGSPPFATKAFAEHKRQRKRRLVVDYRRVNQRILRAIYHVRNRDHVVQEVAGSAAMTMVDACKGFNQLANTKRAREVLAILARSGQFLPQCLTFGNCNGPEDFAFATDRIFAPGRKRKQRFCKNWQIYADDITVRSGRVLDGVIYTDDEYNSRVRVASNKYEMKQQELTDAFKALGFNPEGLSSEGKVAKGKAKPRPKSTGEKDESGLTVAAPSDNSPYAHLCDYLLQFKYVIDLILVVVSGGPFVIYILRDGCYRCGSPTPRSSMSVWWRVVILTLYTCIWPTAALSSPLIPTVCSTNHSLEVGMAYLRGQTAWQVFGSQDYWHLKRFFGHKIDTWSRKRLISMALTNTCRHGWTGFDDETRNFRLAPDGTVAVSTLVNLRVFQIMGITEADIRVVVSSEYRHKVRHHLVDGPGGELRVRVDHAWSGKLADMLDQDEALIPASPADVDWQPVMLHGSLVKHAPSIDAEGLFTGGFKGTRHRAHCHLVTRVDTQREQEGVRNGSDMLVTVDVTAAHEAGAKFYWAKGRSKVLLSSGLSFLDSKGIERDGFPREFLIDLVRRDTGRSLVVQAVPKTDIDGMLNDEDGSLKCELTVSADVAAKIADKVQYVLSSDSEQEPQQPARCRMRHPKAPGSIPWRKDAEGHVSFGKSRRGEDPYKWACSSCYTETAEGLKDTYNSSMNESCWKCRKGRPTSDDPADWRWMCSQCSREDFTVAGDEKTCPTCGRKNEWVSDMWWKNPVVPEEGDPSHRIVSRSPESQSSPSQSGRAWSSNPPADAGRLIESVYIQAQDEGEDDMLVTIRDGEATAKRMPKPKAAPPVLAEPKAAPPTLAELESRVLVMLNADPEVVDHYDSKPDQFCPTPSPLSPGAPEDPGTKPSTEREFFGRPGQDRDRSESVDSERPKPKWKTRAGDVDHSRDAREWGDHVLSGSENSMSFTPTLNKSPASERGSGTEFSDRLHELDATTLSEEEGCLASGIEALAWEEDESRPEPQPSVPDTPRVGPVSGSSADASGSPTVAPPVSETRSSDLSATAEPRVAPDEVVNSMTLQQSDSFGQVVTPVLTGEAVASILEDVMDGEQFAELAAKYKNQVASSFPQEHVKLEVYQVSDRILVKSVQKAGVVYARGDSDNESIRDYDSGTGPIRRHNREEYWFKREMNENEVRYRRRYMCSVRGTEEIMWYPEADSDEDGVVHQTSFILSAQLTTDAAGDVTGPHADVQGYLTTGASSVASRPWDPGFLSVRDGMTVEDDSLDTDATLERCMKIVKNPELDAEGQLAEVEKILSLGSLPALIGEARSVGTCEECRQQMFGSGPSEHAQMQEEDYDICKYCDAWVHGHDCLQNHMQVHALHNFNRGIRMARKTAGRVMTPEDESPEEVDIEALPPWQQPKAKFRKAHKAKLARLNQASQRRKDMQGDSSEEAGLEPAAYCSGCGCLTCFRGNDNCREAGRLENLKYLLKEFEQNTALAETAAALQEPFAEAIARLKTMLRHWDQNVVTREHWKQGVRAKRQLRVTGPALDPQILVGMAGEVDPEQQVQMTLSEKLSGTGKRPQSKLPSMQKNISALTRGRGLRGSKLMASMTDATRHGREYKSGTAAETLCCTVSADYLKEAVLQWRSAKPSIWKEAEKKVRSFLGRVPRTMIHSTGKWAMAVCKIILHGIEKRKADTVTPITANVGVDLPEPPFGMYWFEVPDGSCVLREHPVIGDKFRGFEIDLPPPEPNSRSYWKESTAYGGGKYMLAPWRKEWPDGTRDLLGMEIDPLQSVGARSSDQPVDAGTGASLKESVSKAWKTREFSITMKRLADEQVSVKIWELKAHFRKQHHQHQLRLHRMYLAKDSASSMVRGQMQGVQTTGCSNNLLSYIQERADQEAEQEGLPSKFDDRNELTGAQASTAKGVEISRQKTLHKGNLEEMQGLYDVGSWRCSRCECVLTDSQIECPNWVKANKVALTQEELHKFGVSNRWIPCGGSQSLTWGGYANPLNFTPALLAKYSRGKYRSGTYKDRAVAKTELTEEENRGETSDTDPVRKAEVERTLQCRQNLTDARARKRARLADALAAETERDPFKWACSNCYSPDETEQGGLQQGVWVKDTHNLGNRTKCWKCSHERKKEGSWGDARVVCPECSTDTFTIPATWTSCPDCLRQFDWTSDTWYQNPPRPLDATSKGVSDIKKRKKKRAGKKLKKDKKEDEPARDDMEEVELEEDSDEPVNPVWRKGRTSPSSGARSSDPPADARHRDYRPWTDPPGGLAPTPNLLPTGMTIWEEQGPETTATRSPTPPWRSQGGSSSGGTRSRFTNTFVLGLTLFSFLIPPGESIPFNPPQVAQAGGVAAVLGIGLVSHRSYNAFDHVMSAAENKTVEFVEAVGDAGISLLPLGVGLIVTLILLLLKYLTKRYQIGTKEEFQTSSENPENKTNGQPDLRWVTRDYVASAVSNLNDAAELALKPGMVRAIEGTKRALRWSIDSQTTHRKSYTVTMERRFEDPESKHENIRNLWYCNCPGHTSALKGTSRVCKHIGCLILMHMKATKQRLHTTAILDSGDPRAERQGTQSSSARSSDQPTDAALQLTDSQAITVYKPPKQSSRKVVDFRDLNKSTTRKETVSSVEVNRGGQGDNVSKKTLHTDRGTEFAERVWKEHSVDIVPFGPRQSPAEFVAMQVQAGTGRPEAPRIPVWGATMTRLLSSIGPNDEDFPKFNAEHGRVAAFMNALETHKTATRLCSVAEAFIFLSAYTFEWEEVVMALGLAGRRRLSVTVAVDKQHTFAGSTQAQPRRLQQLVDQGVIVYLVSGEFGGIQHSKTLIADNMVILGSTNWTRATRQNTERSVLLELNDSGKREWNLWMQAVCKGGVLFQNSNPPLTTARQEERFRTARRFSIARSRSVGALL